MDNQKKTKLSAKGPLITPSASPAPSRPFPPRLSDGRSPTKRQRLTATPSRSSESITTPTISFAAQTYHTDTSNDLHNARRASSTHVLNIWSQLAERYSRPLAEDDIVDLRKKDIIKDRNVLRSAPRDYEMGCFADVYRGGADTPTDEGEGDSDDELDAFAPGADISDELELERANREKATAIREMDPADAEDLREFLEAESRWREEFGGEEEEEDERECLNEDEGIDDESAGHVEDPEFEYGSDEKDDFPVDKNGQEHFNHDDEDVDSSSDDELAIWDGNDEGSTVYAIAGDLDSNEIDDNVVEIPLPDDTTNSQSAPSPLKRRGRPRKNPQPQTPSPLRFKSASHMSSPIVQLHTPPQSSSSATGNTPDTFARSQPLYTSSPPRMKPRLATKATSVPESALTSNETAKVKQPPKSKTQETSLAQPSNSKWVAEVVIPRKASVYSVKKAKAASRSTSLSPKAIELSDDDRQNQTSAKAKGKGKAKRPSPDPGLSMATARETESDDPIALVSSPEPPERSFAGQQSASDSERFYTPLPSTPRKRKRVVSASASVESAGNEDEDDSGPSLPLISPEIDLIDFSKHRYDPYEQGQASPLPKPSSRRRKRRDATRRSSSYPEGDSDNEHNSRRSSSQGRVLSGSNSNTHRYSYSEMYSSQHLHNPNHSRHATSVPPHQYSIPQIQGPQAQFLLAQAMHHLSYLMNASGHGHPNLTHPSWPQPGPGISSSSYVPPTSHSSDWSLYSTPSHHRHRRHTDPFDSSPVASSSASAVTTPVHQHPYPYTFNPSMSNATLPPSSPDQSPSSPSLHLPSIRERSQSRGRRVSFRIDDDRPHGLSDRDRSLRFDDDQDNLAQEDVRPSTSSSPSKYASSKRGRSKSARRELLYESAVKTSPQQMHPKGKSKALVTDASGEDAESEESPSRASAIPRSKRFERGQTPGPPSITPASRGRSILRHEKGG